MLISLYIDKNTQKLHLDIKYCVLGSQPKNFNIHKSTFKFTTQGFHFNLKIYKNIIDKIYGLVIKNYVENTSLTY
jgi:hypothetical protein